MTERSRPWNSTTPGDASEAPYDAPTEWAAIWRSLAGAGSVPTNLSGVFKRELNGLAVSGTATPVTVATGRALVYGTWYENDAAVTVAIPTPAALTRIDRIVLRKDWAAQTVRITRIAGVEGGAAPAMTQNAGTTWDQPLATVSITTGGVITVTNGQEFIGRVTMKIVKRLIETINNSASLQDDNELFYPLAANEVVGIHLILAYNSAGGNFTYTFTVPAGATLNVTGIRENSAGTLVEDPITAGTGINNGVSGANNATVANGQVTNGATPGNLQVRWAQQSAAVADTSVLPGSVLEITPVG